MNERMQDKSLPHTGGRYFPNDGFDTGVCKLMMKTSKVWMLISCPVRKRIETRPSTFSSEVLWKEKKSRFAY